MLEKRETGLVLRLPKPNLQVIVLALIAVITLFQTFQLVRINAKVGSAPVKVAPAAAPAGNTNTGTNNNSDVPQSMVGGC